MLRSSVNFQNFENSKLFRFKKIFYRSKMVKSKKINKNFKIAAETGCDKYATGSSWGLLNITAATAILIRILGMCLGWIFSISNFLAVLGDVSWDSVCEIVLGVLFCGCWILLWERGCELVSWVSHRRQLRRISSNGVVLSSCWILQHRWRYSLDLGKVSGLIIFYFELFWLFQLKAGETRIATCTRGCFVRLLNISVKMKIWTRVLGRWLEWLFLIRMVYGHFSWRQPRWVWWNGFS